MLHEDSGGRTGEQEGNVERIKSEDASVELVSASDKLHNARSIVADIRRAGDEVFSRFNLEKEDTLAFYGALVTSFQQSRESKRDLVDELDRVVTEMELLAHRN